MPVLSYLACAAPEQSAALRSALEAIPECELFEADDESVFIVVTETDGIDAERALEQRLDSLPSLAMLTLVFGHRADALATRELSA